MSPGAKRPHRPDELGPRTFKRPGSKYWQVDLRPWGGRRRVMRDPKHPDWPERGERTEIEEIKERWKWAYLSLVRDEHRRRVLRLGPEPMPLGEAAKSFLRHREAQVERSTVAGDRTAVNHLLKHAGREALTTRITSDVLQALFDEMLRRGYAVSTLRTYWRALQGFFGWLGGQNPCDGVKLPKAPKKDVRVWSAAEIERLRSAAEKIDAQRIGKFASSRLALEIALSMGLRQGEIFALRWEDVRERARTVRVHSQVPKDSTRIRHLKDKEARTVLVHPDWWELHESAARGLICGRNGSPVGTRTQRNMITRVLDTAGLNEIGVGWHAARHTYARRYLSGEGGLEAGSMEELQSHLGHAKISTTQERYGHFREEEAVRLGRKRFYGSG